MGERCTVVLDLSLSFIWPLQDLIQLSRLWYSPSYHIQNECVTASLNHTLLWHKNVILCKKHLKKAYKNVHKTYVNVSKDQRMLPKGVHFHLYVAFMTIYMQYMIKVKIHTCVKQVIVSDLSVCGDSSCALMWYESP